MVFIYWITQRIIFGTFIFKSELENVTNVIAHVRL